MTGYPDSELAAAVAEARSWRGVLRCLGLPPQSSSALRSARRRADALGLDYAHFTGQRRWTDTDLTEAIGSSRSWVEVLTRLQLAGGSSPAALKAHAVRLGLDLAHLSGPVPKDDVLAGEVPDVRHLERAGPLLAAAWFTLRGDDVAWPLEPCRYDLLVTRSQRTFRVQVKTTTRRVGGSWVVRISSTRRGGVDVYSPDEVDHFFVIDGDMTFYLIPLAVVGGRQVINLRRYCRFVVGRAGHDAA